MGCLLSRHGMVGEKALERIPEIRKGVAGDFRKSPENEAQRRFVVDWSE